MSSRPSKRRHRHAAQFVVKMIPDEKPILTHEPTPEDLSAFLPEIRAAYREGRRLKLKHILILAIPATSEFAKRAGITGLGPMIFKPTDPAGAHALGLIPRDADLPESKPPIYALLFTSPGGVDAVMVFDGSHLDFDPEGVDDAGMVHMRPEEIDNLEQDTIDRLEMILGVLPIIKRQVEAYHRDYTDDPTILVCDLTDAYGLYVARQSGDVEGIERELQRAKEENGHPLTVLAMPAELAARLLADHSPPVARLLAKRIPPAGTLYAFTLSGAKGSGMCLPLSAIDNAGPDDHLMTEISWHYR